MKARFVMVFAILICLTAISLDLNELNISSGTTGNWHTSGNQTGTFEFYHMNLYNLGE